jgi:hypothetical protein
MKEMKSKILLFCLFATLTLSSCKKTEYTNAIPSDAAAVMTIDMKALAQKSGINDQENATLKQHLTDALKNGLSAETADRMGKIMDDPSKSGFDFSEKVYVYASKEFDFSPVIDLCVDSKRQLTKTIEALAKSQLCTTPEDAHDYQYTILGGKAVLAYNRGTAICVEAKEGMTDKVRTTLDKVMSLKKEKSIRTNKLFDKLKDSKEDISFFVDGKNAMSSTSIFHSDAPGLSLTGHLNFENGRILLVVDKESDTKTPSSTMQPVGNSLLARFPQQMPVMFTIGMKGEETYKELSSLFGLDAMGMPLLENLISSMQGDLVVGYNGYDNKNMSFLAYAQIKDPSLVRNIKIDDDMWGKVEKKGSNDFIYHVMKHNIYYGLDGNILYLTNNAALTRYKSAKGSYTQNPYAAQAKGKSMYFVFDTADIIPAFQQQLGGPLVCQAIEQNITCVRGFDVSPTSWNIEVVWKDKTTNALKQAVKIVRQMAGI